MTALIAVTGRVIPAGEIGRWHAPALAVPRPYLDALERAGGRAAVLARSPLPGAGKGDILAGFDGVLLTGGGDIDPARYGAVPVPEIYGVDAEADAFELGLVHAAISAGLPVLGICRGLQVLNVALGGTLDQHIVGRPGREDHGRPGGEEVVHSVMVERGSRLASALGATEVMGSCHHHQAVEQVGGGLKVSARTPEGIVEGLELEGEPWVVAVQWHPEDTAGSDATQQQLFSSFVAAT